MINGISCGKSNTRHRIEKLPGKMRAQIAASRLGMVKTIPYANSGKWREKMSKPTMHCQSGGYTLRSFQPGQAEKYFADCFANPDPEVDRLTGSSGTYEHDAVVNYYNRIVEDPDRFDFILADPAGNFLGESVINEIDWDTRSANFRIVIFNTQNCAKGLGTWMVEKTRDFAFEALHLHRLELDVFSFNHRARHVYEKAGFRLEGIRKDAIRDGEGYADDVMMAILEDEWREIKKGTP